MSNTDQNNFYSLENTNNSNIINNNNNSKYYSKNIKSISSEDYNQSNKQGGKHLKSISSENVSYKQKSTYQKHYIPRNKRNLKVNQNSHHIKTQNQINTPTNNNMLKSISSDGYQPTNQNSKQSDTSPPKSRMKRLSLTVSVSTQMYLEKIGKNNSTLDSDDIKRLKSLLHDQKVDYSRFNKLSRSSIFAFDKFNTGLSFGEGVFNFGDGGSIKDSPEGEALRELGNQIQDIENSKKDVALGSIQLLLEPLMKFSEEDIKKARELKRKQNVNRIKFEQAVNNLNEIRKKSDPYSSKTKQAKFEEETSRSAYTQINQDFSSTMIQNDKNIKLELRKLIRDYVAYQVEYFRESLESWEEFQEDLEEILPAVEETNVDSPLSAKKHSSPTSKNQKKSHKKKNSKNDDNDEDDDDSSNDDDILNSL